MSTQLFNLSRTVATNRDTNLPCARKRVSCRTAQFCLRTRPGNRTTSSGVSCWPNVSCNFYRSWGTLVCGCSYSYVFQAWSQNLSFDEIYRIYFFTVVFVLLEICQRPTYWRRYVAKRILPYLAVNMKSDLANKFKFYLWSGYSCWHSEESILIFVCY